MVLSPGASQISRDSKNGRMSHETVRIKKITGKLLNCSPHSYSLFIYGELNVVLIGQKKKINKI